MKQLQQPSTLPCVAPYVQPETTHVALVRVGSWTGYKHNELLGCFRFHPSEWNDDRSRLSRIRKRLDRLTVRWQFDTYPADTFSLEPREAKRLTDLQRFKRKMGQVLRAYEETRVAIKHMAHGLFVADELDRLDQELAAAWAKAEQIYKCTKEDYYKPTLTP